MGTGYRKPTRCTHCGFVENIPMIVHGNFDGWEPEDLVQGPEYCPFCKHAKKIGLEVPKQEEQDVADPLNQNVDSVDEAPNEKEEKKEERTLFTLKEWNKKGRWIIKGQKAKSFIEGVAAFSFDQTRSAPTPTLVTNRPRPQVPYDDLEDDIPF